jgi:hypothetical protein
MIPARTCILYLAATGLALAQGYSGQLTAAGCGNSKSGIWGNASYYSNATSVDVYSDGVYLGTVPSGSASTDYYWNFSTPATVKDNQVHAITAMYGGTSIPLKNSPQNLQCNSTSTGYSYTYTDNFTSINPTYWSPPNGSVSTYPSPGGFYSGTTGSVIGTLASTPPNPTGYSASYSVYEVSMTLAILQTPESGYQPYYVQYLRASSNAMVSQSTSQGTYFAVSVLLGSYNSATGTWFCSMSVLEQHRVRGWPIARRGHRLWFWLATDARFPASCVGHGLPGAVLLVHGLNRGAVPLGPKQRRDLELAE